ncbi:MAG TPA: SDR family NAD(P)-dependent oxidoreductase [Flavobacteriales bacterium]|nr:SDR family NAD(P)-dependent oxidoreductase [Flavobacteriales bacterium]
MSNGPTAIVTGAAQGIGRAITEQLVAEGYHVVAVDIDHAAGHELTSGFEKEEVTYIAVDIRQEEAVRDLFEQVMRLRGKVDAVVNNAGIIRDRPIWKMTLEDFQAVLDVNLQGTWLMCREAAIRMRHQKSGAIVNISSRAWLGNPGQSNYAASKAGVVALTRVLALELGPSNVRVNAVAPGLIDTPLTQSLEPEVLQRLIAAQPTRTMGQPVDVAHTVAFLLSDKARFITGQTLYVDGGKSIGAGI